MISFNSLQLIEPIQRALAESNYVNPTPIQAAAIPALLAGQDVIGCAQTGTGKTAAFALPILQFLSNGAPRKGPRQIRALVLSPTRELAAQIAANFETYGKYLRVSHAVIFGGVSDKPQIDKIRRGLDVLVATPGRLLDLIQQGYVNLSHVEFFVLDEADRMLDMGFLPDVRRVLKLLPGKRQNLLFSATMPPAVAELAHTILHNPLRIDITPETPTVEKIEQRVMFVAKEDKARLLAHVLDQEDFDRAIVFTRTKHGADRLAKKLARDGIEAGVIHGDKSQGARERALEGFRRGSTSILIATDIASRGIDVDDITHVFNLDLPHEPEIYVHRIGRTGRAGRSGISISFCDEGEGELLRQIEKSIGRSLDVDDQHHLHCAAAIPAPPKAQQHRSAPRTDGGGQPRRRRRSGGGQGNRSQQPRS